MGVEMGRPVSLRTLLVVPLVLQMTATAGVISLVSYLSDQHNADQNATRLQIRTSRQVAEYLRNYLDTPQQVIQTMAEEVESGRLDPADSKATTKFLWQLHRTFPEAPYLNYGLANGNFIGVGQTDNKDPRPYLEIAPAASINHLEQFNIDDQGQRSTRNQVKSFADFRGDGWYLEPAQARRAVWTTIYNWVDAPQVMVMGAGRPIVKNGRLIGVAGVDVFLANISHYLQNLPLTSNGEMFIVDTNGLLVADSSDRLPFSIVSGKGVRLQASNARDDTIREAARALVQRFGDFGSLNEPRQLKMAVGSGSDLVRVEPFRDHQGLNWRIVVAIPDSDVSGTQRRDALTMLLISLVAISISGSLALLTVRHVNRQLNQLVEGANTLAERDLSREIPSSSIRELALLATSFNALTGRLRKSFATLRSRNREMRRQMDSRTQELKVTSQQLNREILQRRRAENRLKVVHLEQQKLNVRDRLTGLVSRQGFEEQLKQLWQAQGQQDVSLSLLMLDIDHFRQINAHHGHAIGDRCLIWIADLLRGNLHGPTEVLARYGGGEFVVLLPDCDRDQASSRAAQLLLQLRQHPFPQPGGDQLERLSVSIGIASLYPSNAINPEQLIDQADEALHRAKSEGRNRWVHAG